LGTEANRIDSVILGAYDMPTGIFLQGNHFSFLFWMRMPDFQDNRPAATIFAEENNIDRKPGDRGAG
jgi:hypothetical protein